MRFLRQCIVVLSLVLFASVPLARAQSSRQGGSRDSRRVLTPAQSSITYFGNYSYAWGSGNCTLAADNV